MGGNGIESKLAVLRDNLARLATIPQRTFEEFAADFRNVDSYKLGRRGLAPPDASRDILTALEGDGALPTGSAQRFWPLFAFRNRVVHPYDRVDTARVYDILVRHRQDLAALLDLLLAIPD